MHQLLLINEVEGNLPWMPKSLHSSWNRRCLSCRLCSAVWYKFMKAAMTWPCTLSTRAEAVYKSFCSLLKLPPTCCGITVDTRPCRRRSAVCSSSRTSASPNPAAPSCADPSADAHWIPVAATRSVCEVLDTHADAIPAHPPTCRCQ